MSILSNIYLFSVGLAIALIGTLGFIVYFNNRKSVTNRTFLAFSLVSIAWNICNYLIEQNLPHDLAIWVLRGVVFFAVWYCFTIFQLLYVFPKEDFAFSRRYKFILVPLVVIISILTLTSLVFARVLSFSAQGSIESVQNGLGIFVFGATVVILIFAAIFSFIKKMVHVSREERKPLIFVLIGTAITFVLYIVFNFIYPAFFNRPQYSQLGAVFTFPFVALTAYAIIKHHLLNVKVFAAQALTVVLSIVMLAQVIVATNIVVIIFQSSLFVLVLAYGILLIRSVQREVEQREELERLDKQLEEKNKQLDELSHFKSELLSLASHQIRSPLAAVKGFLSLVIGGTYGAIDPKAKEALEKARHSADELIGLINTLLDLRKVEEGKMEYTFAPADIRKMAQDVFALLEPLAVTKNLEFKLIAPDHPIWVSADEQKLKQIVQNLTDNAIKYTPNGFVHIELKEENMPGTENIVKGDKIGTVTLAVSDSGFGMSAELIPHLFEEFMRDARVKTQIRGTGLGLFIARKIAEAHGGKIWAESPGEGKGSTFFLSLPEIKQ